MVGVTTEGFRGEVVGGGGEGDPGSGCLIWGRIRSGGGASVGERVEEGE